MTKKCLAERCDQLFEFALFLQRAQAPRASCDPYSYACLHISLSTESPLID